MASNACTIFNNVSALQPNFSTSPEIYGYDGCVRVASKVTKTPSPCAAYGSFPILIETLIYYTLWRLLDRTGGFLEDTIMCWRPFIHIVGASRCESERLTYPNRCLWKALEKHGIGLWSTYDVKVVT
jgi:hypothetical protein